MKPSSEHPFTVEREVLIRAPRDVVFRYFSDSARFARWWGEGSTIEARPGGVVRIVHPGGTVVLGEVLEVDPGERIVFTYGYEAAGGPIAPGGSRVTITLAGRPGGTLVRLIHAFADPAAGNGFEQGWRFQLAVFANVVAGEAHADAAARADRWFEAWNETDAAARQRAFAACAVEGVTFADTFSCTRGLEDLDAHVGAGKIHMPGIRIRRSGEPMQCQGAALVGWSASDAEGRPMGSGTNLFEFAPDGRIERVVGFWGPGRP